MLKTTLSVITLAATLMSVPYSAVAGAGSASVVTLRTGYNSTNAFGGKYQNTTTGSPGLFGDYSFALDEQWRFKLAAGATIDGRLMTFAGGVAYHFIPLSFDAQIIGDNVKMTTVSLWSPYIGAELGMTRVQLALPKAGGGSDVVLAGLVGPSLHIGTYYTFSPNWGMVADGHFIYGFSSDFAASALGFSVGVMYVLGR